MAHNIGQIFYYGTRHWHSNGQQPKFSNNKDELGDET